jgi:hypothetical protein
MVLCFTSEEAAREGERKEPPPELKAQMEEMDALSVARRSSSTSAALAVLPALSRRSPVGAAQAIDCSGRSSPSP